MIKNRKSRYTDSAGVALVELALIVPILLFLFLGGVELTRALYTRTALVGFAREVSSYAFRTSLGLSIPDTTARLQQIIDESWVVFEREFPGATIRLRLVKHGSRTTTSIPNQTVTWNFAGEAVRHGVGVQPTTRPSRLGAIDQNGDSAEMNLYFQPTNTAQYPRRDLLLQNQGYILFGEFYYPYRSLVPGIGGMFAVSDGLMYARLEY